MSNYTTPGMGWQAGPPTAPAGWYDDPQGGGQRYWDGWSWHAQAASTTWPSAAGHTPAPAYAYSDPAADSTARGIATYERASGVAWIILGILQVLSIVLIIAGVWNILAGISRLAVAPRIERREAAVPRMFEGVVGLVLIGLVNLVFGAVLGVVMVVVDFYVRQRVLDNRHIFTR